MLLAAKCPPVMAYQAAPATPDRSIGLTAAFEAALKHSRRYKADVYGKKASDMLKWEGLSAVLPQLNASMNYLRYDFVNPPPYYLSYDSKNISLNFSQPVISFRRFLLYEQYKDRASIGEAQFKSKAQKLVLGVARAYLDVLSSREYLAALIAQKAAVRSEMLQSKKLYAAGAGTITDVYEARARYYSVLSKTVEARYGLKNSLRKFKNMTGITGASLKRFKKDMPLKVPRPASAAYWVKLGAKHNPDLEYYRKNRDYYKNGERKNLAANLPTLSFVAGYSATNSQEYIQTPPLRYFDIGFQVSMPIFQGGYGLAKTLKDSNLASQANQQYRAELDKNAREIKKAFEGIKGDIAKIKMLELSLESARVSLKGNRLGFKAGIRTVTDVLNAVQAYYDARVRLSRARYEYVLGTLNLYLNAGVLSGAELKKINGWLGN